MKKKINVKVNKNNWQRLKTFSDNSMDKNLNLLMDIVERDMPFVNFADERTTINCYEDTYERLDSFKISVGESRDNIITRMFICFDELNNTETWIPFKLTSRVNKKLIVTGEVGLNSEDMFFNEGNEIYGLKLPSTYIVGGEDLTDEYISWVGSINWTEIKKIVLDHCNEEYVNLKTQSSIIDINYL